MCLANAKVYIIVDFRNVYECVVRIDVCSGDRKNENKAPLWQYHVETCVNLFFLEGATFRTDTRDCI